MTIARREPRKDVTTLTETKHPALILRSSGERVTDDVQTALEWIKRECAEDVWRNSGSIIKTSTRKSTFRYVLVSDPRGVPTQEIFETMNDVANFVNTTLRSFGANLDVDVENEASGA